MDFPKDLVPDISSATLYRYYAAIREHLEINSEGKEIRHIAARAMYMAAQVMESPTDFINAAVQTILLNQCELPAFSTLDRMAWRIRRLVNRRIEQTVFARLTETTRQVWSWLPEAHINGREKERKKQSPEEKSRPAKWKRQHSSNTRRC